MQPIPSIFSIPDGLTKALGWVLHSRHALRMMGHFLDALSVAPYITYLIDSVKYFCTGSIPVPVCSTVDNLNSLMPIWKLVEGVDQPVQ